MGLMPIYRPPRTRIPVMGHKIYTALLRELEIERLWRSLTYARIYLHAFSGGRVARRGGGGARQLGAFQQPPVLSYRPWRRDASLRIPEKAEKEPGRQTRQSLK